jgi:hypothetical protein
MGRWKVFSPSEVSGNYLRTTELVINSKFRLLTPSGGVLIVFIFFDLILLAMFISSLRNGPISEDKIASYIFGFIIFIFFNGIGIIQYIVTNPKWNYKEGILTIYYYDRTKNVIKISDAEIDICGLHQIPFLLGMSAFRDAVSFKVNNKTHYLPIDNYSNINELQRIILITTKGQTPNDFELHNCESDNIETFVKYNKWGPFVFHVFYLIIPFYLLLFLSTKMPIAINIILKLIAFWLIYLSGRLTNYICLSDKHLIIKNNFYFWKKEVYLKSDIRNIYLDRASKAPTRLYLTLRNFEKKAYIVESVGIDNLSIISNDLRRNGTISQGI